MKAKPFWIIIAFLVWGAGSTYWYVCKIKGFCATKNTAVVNKAPAEAPPEEVPPQVQKPATEHGLIYYKKNQSEALINDSLQWAAEVKSIAQLQAEGKKLRIEAPYYSGEINNSGFDNLGIARAENLKKLFSSTIDTALIITGGKLVNGNDIPEFTNGYKGYVNWVNHNDFVKENRGKTLIYFPVNSTQEIKNKAIILYLDELADNMKKHPGYKVQITGYTDNTGSAKKNEQLGLRRAKRIQSLLLKKGIPQDRIIVKSEGENNPIADNNTPEGRQKNRRVEIIIIQNK